MSGDRIPVQHERLVRDTRSKALLSTDREAILAYETRKRERQTQTERINTLEEKVSQLQEALSKLLGNR